MNRVNYSSISDFKESNLLPGAISPETKFLCIDKNDEIDMVPLKENVSDRYKIDEENELFVGRNGAIANAFDFRHLGVLEEVRSIRNILEESRQKYPGYDFEIIPGHFPIKMKNKTKEPVFSTHILFIKNYQNFIRRAKRLIKK